MNEEAIEKKLAAAEQALPKKRGRKPGQPRLVRPARRWTVEFALVDRPDVATGEEPITAADVVEYLRHFEMQLDAGVSFERKSLKIKKETRRDATDLCANGHHYVVAGACTACGAKEGV